VGSIYQADREISVVFYRIADSSHNDPIEDLRIDQLVVGSWFWSVKRFFKECCYRGLWCTDSRSEIV